jgi:hypothetical protein
MMQGAQQCAARDVRKRTRVSTDVGVTRTKIKKYCGVGTDVIRHRVVPHQRSMSRKQLGCQLLLYRRQTNQCATTLAVSELGLVK